MAKVIVLSQSISTVRYAGPYVAVNSARKHGHDVVVLDHYLKHPNSIDLIKSQTSSKTELLVISTTFIYSRFDGNHRSHAWTSFKEQNLNLNFQNQEELATWLRQVRAVLPKTAKIALAGERVNKIYSFYELISESHPLKSDVDLFFLGRDDDLLLNFLEGNTGRFQTLKNNFLLGIQSEGFKNGEIPTKVFSKRDGISENETLPIEISRGCAFNCSYCSYDKKTVNKLSKERLKEQFHFYFNEFGTTNYFFTTECFNDNKQFVYDFHEVTQSLPFEISWTSYARPDLAYRFPETIDMMLESGAKANLYGIETLNRSVAKSVGRPMDFEKIMKVLDSFKEKAPDYFIKAFFIIGLPGDPITELKKTISWMEEQNTIDAVSAQVLEIEPMSSDLHKLFDVADFSLSPAKYGIDEISFFPNYYWKHSEMDLPQAVNLEKEFKNAISTNPYMVSAGSLAFAELQGIGAKDNEVRKILMNKDEFKLYDHCNNMINEYHNRMLSI